MTIASLISASRDADSRSAAGSAERNSPLLLAEREIALPEEVLQAALDADVARTCLWLAPVLFVTALRGVLHQFKVDNALPYRSLDMGVNLINAAGMLWLTFLAWRRTTPPGLAARVFKMLLAFILGQAIVMLQLDREPDLLGVVAIAFILAGFTFSTVRNYLLLVVVGLLGTLPFVWATVPRAEVASTFVILTSAGITGVFFLRARRGNHQRLELLRLKEQLSTGSLREAVARLEREISQRAHSEESLRQSERRYRSLVDNSIVGVFQCTLEGRLTFANLTMAQVLGFDSVADLLAAHGTSGAPLVELLQALEAGRLVGGDCTLTDRSGCTLSAVLHAQRAGDTAGRAIGYEGMLLDVTARAAAAEALRLQREQLIHASRLASLGEMLAAIAHEVNQPLHAIVQFAGASAQMIGHIEDPAVAKVRHWNDQIACQAERCGAIIRRLRAFARKAQPQSAPIVLRELIDESIALTDPVRARTRVQVEVAYDASIPPLVADGLLIEQTLTNLMLNAYEAMSDNPPLASRQLTVEACRRDADVEIVVRDTGPGLPVAASVDIFEAFVSDKPNGLGLGLAICRTIVEAHGGRIWASPAENSGAEFHLMLPLRTAREPDGVCN
ncbi:MAG: PAS domain-containing protein [Pirellulales bacterium]|nr:PAS domain-containing protein [Pirellulales bacterium]